MNVSDNVNVAQTLAELPQIIDNLLLLLSDKEKEVVKKRFNLDGTRKYTLEEIGQRFSVTRERIRQIEKNALAKMKRNVFNTSLKFLHEFVSSVVDLNGGLIKEEDLILGMINVISREFKINENSAHLAFILHDEVDCIGNTINFFPYVRRSHLNDYSLKHASNKLINQLHKYGDIKPLDKVHTDLKPVFEEFELGLNSVRSIIQIDKRLTILDDDLVGLLEWRHIHPRTLREKILYIFRSEKKPLHFTDIAERIEKENFDNRKINLQAVHNELIRHEQFILIGRGIYALKEWGYEKGTVVDVISRILNKHDELSLEEIIELVLEKRQIKRITVQLALKNNEKFERIGRKRYKLKA
ncbi:hypothetical protein GF354_01185 [Candidatus Peregrinibacteria bacterium]|nr:hypothetical protein [Candidatus Peregrinibacteria bacterium]